MNILGVSVFTTTPRRQWPWTGGSSPPRRRAALYAVIAVLLGVGGNLLFLEIALRILPVRAALEIQPVTRTEPIRRLAPDRELQYSVAWNFAIRNRVHVNRQGFVNDQDYDPGARSPLLAVIGDSYMEALMVPYRETLHGRPSWSGIAVGFTVSAPPARRSGNT